MHHRQKGGKLARGIEERRQDGQPYVEPFVGGANVMSRISAHGPREGSDLHGSLIDFWRSFQGGWSPPDPEEITREIYDALKEAAMVGPDGIAAMTTEERADLVWVGYGCSYGGMWFNGRKSTKDIRGSVNTLLKQRAGLADVQFQLHDYRWYEQQGYEDCVVYADPPYQGRDGFEAVGNSFRHDEFWDVMHKLAQKRNTVLVTEATLPAPNLVREVKPYKIALKGKELQSARAAGRSEYRQEYLIVVK